MTSLQERVRARVFDVPDFPKPGILFKDITPVLMDPQLMRDLIEHWAEEFKAQGITHIAGIESRGFLFGAPLAVALSLPMVIIRKPGKLPRPTRKVIFDLEYGQDELHMHEDALDEDARVLIVDDLLATGGTAAAAAELVEGCGAHVHSFLFLVELAFLKGRNVLAPHKVRALDVY